MDSVLYKMDVTPLAEKLEHSLSCGNRNISISSRDNFVPYAICQMCIRDRLWTNDKGEHIQYTYADLKKYTDMTCLLYTSLGFYSNSVVNKLQQEVADRLGKLSGYDDYQLFRCV